MYCARSETTDLFFFRVSRLVALGIARDLTRPATPRLSVLLPGLAPASDAPLIKRTIVSSFTVPEAIPSARIHKALPFAPSAPNKTRSPQHPAYGSQTRTMATIREEKTLSDLPNGHMRNQHEYSYRLPTAPRIVVPPPTLTTDMPGLSLGGTPGGDVDMSFLNELDLEDIIQKNTLLEWAYERRRQAQMILPWVYLGPMVAARDKAFLEREGITMVLAVRAQANSMSGAMQAATQVCMEVGSIESPSFYSLTPRFPDATSMINSHIARVRQHSLETTGQATLGKVLVFCESGNEKSAAVVAAYLMQTLNNIDYIKAMQVCQAQRFCVNFDDVLKNILRSYWDILLARRSIAASYAQAPHQNGLSNGSAQPASLSLSFSSSKQKRGIEDTRDGDDDTNMEDGMDASDVLRFTGRDVTPFQDR